MSDLDTDTDTGNDDYLPFEGSDAALKSAQGMLKHPAMQAILQKGREEVLTKTIADEPSKRGTSSGRLIDPPKEDEVLVTYPDTLDGFVAAWVVRKVATKHNIALEMQTSLPTDGLSKRNWILIGEDGLPIGGDQKSLLAILRGPVSEHSKPPLPFKTWKRTFPFGIESMTPPDQYAGTIGTTGSLAAATWDFFYADRKGLDPRPRFIDYLNDSLTVNRFGDTDAVVACAESYERQFRTFDQFIEACDDRKRLAYVIAGGQAILRYKALHEAATD